MMRRLALLTFATLLLLAPALPAQAANEAGLLNRIARSLGLGWSNGYHSRPAGPMYAENGWQAYEMDGRMHYEAVPPGHEVAPTPAASRYHTVPQR